ncbi:MAG: hypothetical protein ACI97A_004433 [Planctomycetota bacterium]|jgi:hypothetical protein
MCRKTPTDSATKREDYQPVEKEMRFGEYLVSRGIVTVRDVLRSLCWQHEQQEPIGRIALRHRCLNVHQVMRILGSQGDDRIKAGETGGARMFGEYAVELGYMEPAEVEELLVLQINSRPSIGAALVERGTIASAALPRYLADFLHALSAR